MLLLKIKTQAFTFIMATSKSSRRSKITLDTVKVVSIVAIIALVVLIVLTLFDVIKLCPSRAGAKHKKMKKTKKVQAKVPAEEEETGSSQTGTSMLDMPLEEALHEFEKMDKAVMILGQNSCPACRMCKEFYGKRKMGDRVLFVDLMEMQKKPEIAKNKYVSKALKMIGNGVPFIVLFDVKNGDVLDQMTGFDEAKAGAMYEKCAGGQKNYKTY
jgi:hypothetical protein